MVVWNSELGYASENIMTTHAGNCNIYFEVHGLSQSACEQQDLIQALQYDLRPKVLMLMGVAASCKVWYHQLTGLIYYRTDQEQEAPYLAIILDNRGTCFSSQPKQRTHYSIEAMALDAIAVMDYLNCDQFHVVGHSMGGMISQRLAVMQCDRVLSMTLLGTGTPGPVYVTFRTIKAFCKVCFSRTPYERAKADLYCHFLQETLDKQAVNGQGTIGSQLTQEYMHNSLEFGPAQTKDAMYGQLYACGRHKLSKQEKQRLRNAPFEIFMVHGRHDIITSPSRAQKLALQLGCSLVMVEANHFLFREQGDLVDKIIDMAVLGYSRHMRHLEKQRHLDPQTSIKFEEYCAQKCMLKQKAHCIA